MPKEVIVSSAPLYPTEDGEMPEGHLELKWGRETGVIQIITMARHAETGRAFKGKTGFHVDLNRQQVNALIRYLRRARDQMYGPDE